MITALRVAGALASLSSENVERDVPGSAPKAFRIWKAGANVTDHGVHVFTKRSAALLVAQQEKRGNLFSIDVDHLSLSPSAPPESRRAVGWHKLEVRDSADGPELWATEVQWTDAVRAGLEKEPPEWRYFSPAYDVSKEESEIVGYTNTALTNSPATWSVTTLATQAAAKRRLAMMTEEQLTAALMAWAGDDEEKQADARAQIAADFPADEGDDTDPKEEKKAAEDPPKKGDDGEKGDKGDKGDEGDKGDKGDKKESVAASSALSTAMLTRLEELERRDVARRVDDEKREREAIFASRPDVTEGTKKILATEKPARLRELLSAIPVPTKARPNQMVKATATRGEGQGGDGSDGLDPEESKRIDARMGLGRQGPAIVHAGRESTYRPMGREEAQRVLASMAKKNEEAAR